MAMAGEAQRDRDLLLHIKRYCDDALDAARQAGGEAEHLPILKAFCDQRLDEFD